MRGLPESLSPASVAGVRLSHLLLCRTLASTGTVHGAARMLHRTQSAVTKMLQELEASIGMRLFERGRLGTYPTESGRAFLRRAEVMLNEWESLRDELRAIEAGDAGLLRVGATPTMLLSLLPRALGRFLARRPGMQVRSREGSMHDMLIALDAGEVDCVVGRFSGDLLDSEAVRTLRIERLYDETLVVVAGAGHPLARRRRVDWPDLAAARWVLPPSELATRHLLNTEFVRGGATPPLPLMESTSFSSSVSLAHELDALALVPLDVARLAQRRGQVRVLGTPMSSFSAPIAIVQRPGALQGEAYADFLAAVRAAAAQASSRGTAPGRNAP